MKLSTYVYTFLQAIMVHIKTNCSFIMVKFHTTFFAFQSCVPFAISASNLKCWSSFVIRFFFLDFNWQFSCHSSLLIYPSVIRRFDQHQGNVPSEFQMRNFTIIAKLLQHLYLLSLQK